MATSYFSRLNFITLNVSGEHLHKVHYGLFKLQQMKWQSQLLALTRQTTTTTFTIYDLRCNTFPLNYSGTSSKYLAGLGCHLHTCI